MYDDDDILPINVIQDIATALRKQSCVVYNAEKDVAAISEAFRLEGDILHVAPTVSTDFPSYYSQNDGRLHKMMQCSHCVDYLSRMGFNLHTFISSAPKMGKKKPTSNIDGDYARKVILKAHGSDSTAWLACEINRVTQLTLPSWFICLWLPMKARSLYDMDVYYKYITEAWKSLKNVDAARPGDESRSFVRSCDDNKLETCQLWKWASDLPSVSFSRRKNAVVECVKGNLGDALETVDVDRFVAGTVSRAMAVCSATPWIPEALLQSAVAFVLTGGNNLFSGLSKGGLHKLNQNTTNLIKTLSSKECRMKAAIEKAEYFDVEYELDGSASEIFDAIEAAIKHKDIVDQFDALDMDVYFLFDDKIDDVKDRISGATSSDIHLLGVEIWDESNGRFGGRWLHDMTPEELREAFDRRAKLIDALQERGIELRSDSSLCKDYVLYGTYNGPCFSDDDDLDELESVVEMMLEMAFLFETRYSVDASAIDYETIIYAIRYSGVSCRETRSDIAKLAFVYQHVKMIGSDVDELPIRLRAMAKDAEFETKLKNAWDYVDKWHISHEECSSDEYYSSSDEERFY